MITLNGDEARVLGVLIEKSTTTPEQYPLSLNAITSGCNQKSNRDPVLTMSEDPVFDAVESLRAKQLVLRVEQATARVHKFKHIAGETLQVRSGGLAVLAELLLRGPQTLGELRGRASRMHPMETLESARDYLRGLMERTEPLVKEIPPAPGSRAERFVQLLSSDLHPLDLTAKVASTASSSPAPGSGASELGIRVDELEREVTTLAGAIRSICATLDIPDPLSPPPPPVSPQPCEHQPREQRD
jgi:uncharacterized protein